LSTAASRKRKIHGGKKRYRKIPGGGKWSGGGVGGNRGGEGRVEREGTRKVHSRGKGESGGATEWGTRSNFKARE